MGGRNPVLSHAGAIFASSARTSSARQSNGGRPSFTGGEIAAGISSRAGRHRKIITNIERWLVRGHALSPACDNQNCHERSSNKPELDSSTRLNGPSLDFAREATVPTAFPCACFGALTGMQLSPTRTSISAGCLVKSGRCCRPLPADDSDSASHICRGSMEVQKFLNDRPVGSRKA